MPPKSQSKQEVIKSIKSHINNANGESLLNIATKTGHLKIQNAKSYSVDELRKKILEKIDFSHLTETQFKELDEKFKQSASQQPATTPVSPAIPCL